jgi:hypothetical protein
MQYTVANDMRSDEEKELLAQLDALVSDAGAVAWLEGASDRLLRLMSDDPTVDIAFEVIPLPVISPPPPTVSGWVFALRSGMFSGAERHPNSTQRMAAIRGSGVFLIWDGSAWLSTPLSSEAGAVEDRWISIPPNVWHQSAPPETHWVVVSFHTVPAEQLIEERGDPATETLNHRARYLEENTR